MRKTYFLHALRNIQRNKIISFINVFGLSVSLTLALHLIVYVKFELSYDKFHTNHDRIYRLLSKVVNKAEGPEVSALNEGEIPDAINVIPEVEQCIRVSAQKVDVEYDNKRVTGNRILYADRAFFNVFTFELLYGNRSEVLLDPASMVISRTMAMKVFKSLDVVGKPIRCAGKDFIVSGVMEDVPSNSHLQFEMVCNTDRRLIRNMVEHSHNEFFTYVLLRQNVDHETALKKIAEEYKSLLKKLREDSDWIYEGQIQPLRQIELHSMNINWDVPHGNLGDIWLATGLIGFILMIAVLNFINLETANAHSRLKEIAVSKITGASRTDLIRQFIGEKVFTSLISGILALMFLASFSQPVVNRFTGKEIPESLIFNPWILGSLLFVCIMIGVIAGIYPAIYVSRFTVSRVLTGSVSKGIKANSLIRTLVFSQFAIVIILVSGLLIFYRQMEYIRDKDLGFDKEYVVAVGGLDGTVVKNYPAIKQELIQTGLFDNICLAQGINEGNFSGQYAVAVGTGAEPSLVHHTRTTHGFAKTFKLNIISGRDFDSSMIADKKNYLINEAAARILGFEGDPVGRRMAMWDTGVVIGVVKDFNFASLHDRVEPLIITLDDLNWGYLFVRLKAPFIQEGLDLLNRTIKERDPLYSLEYEFVDDKFASMYNKEDKMRTILSLCTYISLVIAFMGLTALTSFTILRRIKEIGIRKINGASVREVLLLLNRDYIRLIAFAFLTGVPLSWFVMKRWLDGFAFRIDLNLWFFAISGLLVLVITLVSVSLISWKAANRNPVEALRYE